MPSQSNARRRAGQTLLELMGATTILAVSLVPTLRITRDSMRVARETEEANNVATFAASKLEEQLLRTAVNWSATTVTGDFSAEGFPTLRFRVTRSESPGDGGIPGMLMAITSTAWVDADNDGQLDASEVQAVFATKLAHLLAHELEADDA